VSESLICLVRPGSSDSGTPGWAQVVDVQVTKTVTEWTLPGRR
jgi:hypothetical protein